MPENLNYLVSIVLMMVAFYGIVSSGNLVKKLMCLSMFQVSVLLFYISGAYVKGGAAPIIKEGMSLYTNPLPHVLMLTAIVVGVATMALGLAIAVRIREEYGTIEEEEIFTMDKKKKKREKSKK